MKLDLLIPQLLEAVQFASTAHMDQVRGGVLRTPYVNHCFDVARKVSMAGFTDIDTMVAALLHDTVEDTSVTEAQIREKFGARVAGLVQDLTLPKDIAKDREAKHAFQLERMKTMDLHGQAIKIADKTSNVFDLYLDPPKWGMRALRGYSDSAREVVQAASHGKDGRIDGLVYLFHDAYRTVSTHYKWENLK